MYTSHSCNVQTSSKDDITLYGIGSRFHFLIKWWITHYSCSTFKFTTSLVQPDNCPHYKAFRNIRELTNFCKWSSLQQRKIYKMTNQNLDQGLISMLTCETFAHSYTTSTRPNLRFSFAYSSGVICNLNPAWRLPSLIAVSYNLEETIIQVRLLHRYRVL